MPRRAEPAATQAQCLPPAWPPRPLQVALHEADPAPRPRESPDPDDLVFLALAKAIGAVLVTGNLANLSTEIRDGVIVLSPSDYLAQIAEEGERVWS